MEGSSREATEGNPDRMVIRRLNSFRAQAAASRELRRIDCNLKSQKYTQKSWGAQGKDFQGPTFLSSFIKAPVKLLMFMKNIKLQSFWAVWILDVTWL